MASKTTIGGERLGAGEKMKAHLRSYERSTHNLGYKWKSSLACGTLVPFMSEVGLTGDSFKIKLDTHIMTLPTEGPLFGSFKVQLDVFLCPIRLYQKKLHNNALNIGMDMANIKLPQVRLRSHDLERDDNGHLVEQINPSSIFSYLNIRGLGENESDSHIVERNFNAVPWLAYWDIYKNYYANKAEEVGAVIHNWVEDEQVDIHYISFLKENGVGNTAIQNGPTYSFTEENTSLKSIKIVIVNGHDPNDLNLDRWQLSTWVGNTPTYYTLRESWMTINYHSNYVEIIFNATITSFDKVELYRFPNSGNDEANVVTFPLDNLDDMRDYLLTKDIVQLKYENTDIPFKWALEEKNWVDPDDISKHRFFTSLKKKQEGLALKTYQSDLFNNWISTEWIDGDNGINELTRVKVDENGFLLDDLNIMQKVYLMLNRIAISGGSYKDWLETVYDTKITNWNVESPVYLGGLIKELTFDEVVSNSAAVNTTQGSNVSQPLGTLGGKGIMTKKHKGGFIDVRVSEPSYIIGIISLTPRVDYSQGNKWDVNLKTMNDFHKPQLDGIGFQDLITDQMAYFDTTLSADTGQPIFKSAGKQPAWLNYMTNVNQVRGNFALEGEDMFMTLNRRYEATANSDFQITDLTTYIDPKKFNNIFAYTNRDAQNFWAQIKLDITARRKMSAKIMPNL